MTTASIIEQIDSEIARLQQAKALLASAITKKVGRPKGNGRASITTIKPVATKPTKNVMSAAGKERIAAAQRARWAKVRKGAKKTA